MRTTVDAKEINRAVDWARRAIPSRPTVPVLAAARLTAADGILTVDGYDYEIHASAGVSADGDLPTVLVHADVLSRILAPLSGDVRLELSPEGNQLIIRAGSRKSQLPTMPSDDYPSMPPMPPLQGTADRLGADLPAGAHAAADLPFGSKPIHMVMLDSTGDGSLRLLSTDRVRVARTTTPYRGAEIHTGVIASTATSLIKALPDGPIGIHLSGGTTGNGHVGFSSGRWAVSISRYDESQYPVANTAHFIDARWSTGAISVPRTALIETVKAATAVLQPAGRILLTIDGTTLTVETDGPKNADWSDALEVDVRSGDNGADPIQQIRFLPKYLTAALEAFPHAWVQISLGPAATKPILIEGDNGDGTVAPGARVVMMPVKVV